MDQLYASYFLLFLIVQQCDCLSIEHLTVPSIVKANSSGVVLDCDYRVEEWEKDDGFVLKWYMDSVNLVYQWIPPRPPQVLGNLAGRLDMTYTASADPWEQHRALRIPRPDAELSGIYSCTVATFEAEDTDSAKMMVWAPPVDIQIEQWRPSDRVVNFTCIAFDVSPAPDFRLYVISRSGFRRRIQVRSTVKHPGTNPGLLRVEGSGHLSYDNMNIDSTLGCVVHLPDTEFKQTREVTFNNELPVVATTTSTTPKSLPDEEAVKSPAFSVATTNYSYSSVVLLLTLPLFWSSIYKRCH